LAVHQPDVAQRTSQTANAIGSSVKLPKPHQLRIARRTILSAGPVMDEYLVVIVGNVGRCAKTMGAGEPSQAGG